jgi:hypothetical protein
MTSYFPGIVLATLGLLILTSSVTAESTWLLWNTYTETRSDPKTRSTEHAIVRAFDTQQACEQVVPSHVQAQIRTWGSGYERLRVSPTGPRCRNSGWPEITADRLERRCPDDPRELLADGTEP